MIQIDTGEGGYLANAFQFPFGKNAGSARELVHKEGSDFVTTLHVSGAVRS